MATATHPSDDTETVRKRYNRGARFYDLHQAAAERLVFRGRRRQFWTKAPTTGSILELGVGTGVNIGHYPPDARVTAIDLSEQMLARARRRAERLHAAVDLALMDAQHLDFLDATFDAVVSTCVFCSVPDPVVALREAWRVLRPGGKLLLLEHMRSDNAALGKVMDVLNPLMVRMSGANINRRTLENLRRAGVPEFEASRHVFGIVKLIEARKPAADA